MSSSNASLPSNDKSGFGVPSRHITTHDDEGHSKFVPESVVTTDTPWEEFAPVVFSSLLWATTTSPAQMTDEADLKAFTSGMIKSTDIVTSNGTNVRMVDSAPGFESGMHRTDSIDYAVLIRGTIELHVESGEVRIGQPGDVFVVRGTNHQWRNPSKTEWTRMCFVVVAADPLMVGGKKLEATQNMDSAIEKE